MANSASILVSNITPKRCNIGLISLSIVILILASIKLPIWTNIFQNWCKIVQVGLATMGNSFLSLNSSPNFSFLKVTTLMRTQLTFKITQERTSILVDPVPGNFLLMSTLLVPLHFTIHEPAITSSTVSKWNSTIELKIFITDVSLFRAFSWDLLNHLYYLLSIIRPEKI